MKLLEYKFLLFVTNRTCVVCTDLLGYFIGSCIRIVMTLGIEKLLELGA